MKNYWLIPLFFWGLSFCQAQEIRVELRISDSLTKQPLSEVTVRLPSNQRPHFTGKDGTIRFKNEMGELKIRLTHTDYNSFEQEFFLLRDTLLTVMLTRQARLLAEVVVKGTGYTERVNSVQMGTQELTHQQLQDLPSMLGEKDIVKALMLTPGVKTLAEGSSAMYVRGGSSDQNLLLLNGASLYFSSHLLGLLTPYNPDILQRAVLTKGGFPAWYGGRLSSVLDVSTRTASLQKTELSASIGFLAARLMVGVPVVKDKVSLLVAARHSFLHLLLLPNPDAPIPNFSFYDLDSKLLFKLRKNQQLTVFGHLDQDALRYNQNNLTTESKTDFRWRNNLSGVQWQYAPNPQTDLQTEVGYSAYQMRVNVETKDQDFIQRTNFKTGLTDYYLKASVNRRTARAEHVWGIHYNLQFFNPGRLTFQLDTARSSLSGGRELTNHFVALFWQSTFPLTPRMSISLGARLSLFANPERVFFSPEPRLTLTRQLTESSSLKLSYSRMQQPIHLLSNPGIGIPLDLLFPASLGIAPATAQQVSVGFFKRFNVGGSPFLFSSEAYYKKFRNIISYKDGVGSTDVIQFGFAETPSFTDLVTVGRGRAYGLEVMLEKQGKYLSGWLGYTLARSEQQFSDLNRGRWFFPNFDRRHDISLTLTYRLSTRWTLSTNWVYGTGQAVTLPILAYQTPELTFSRAFSPPANQLLYTQSDRNAFRMIPYHRLDISAQHHKKHRRWDSTFEFGLYNAYNRRNPFFYQLALQNGAPRLQSVSLFPVLPAVSYTIKIR